MPIRCSFIPGLGGRVEFSAALTVRKRMTTQLSISSTLVQSAGCSTFLRGLSFAFGLVRFVRQFKQHLYELVRLANEKSVSDKAVDSAQCVYLSRPGRANDRNFRQSSAQA